MRRAVILFVAVAFVLSMFAVAMAAEVKGKVESVDVKAGKITIMPEGAKKAETLSVEKTVDLSKVEKGSEVTLVTEKKAGKTVVKEIKAAAPAAPAAPAPEKKSSGGY